MPARLKNGDAIGYDGAERLARGWRPAEGPPDWTVVMPPAMGRPEPNASSKTATAEQRRAIGRAITIARRLNTALAGGAGDVEERRLRLRIRHAFSTGAHLVDLLALQALELIGVDARAAATLAHINPGMTVIEHEWGEAVVCRRHGVIGGDVPIGSGVRITSHDDGRRIVTLASNMPETLLVALAGRPLTDLVSHPLIDALEATIVHAWPSTAISPDTSMKGVVVELDRRMAPTTWREAHHLLK